MGTPEPSPSPRRGLLRVDAWILENLAEAAEWIRTHGGPAELATLVRVAAADLEKFYVAGQIPGRAWESPDEEGEDTP